MFTDRYIKIPIKLYDRKQEELMGVQDHDCELIDIEMRINPFKVENYWPAIPGELSFDEKNVTCTRVVMESGEAHLVYITIDEFEKLLNTQK